MKQLTGFAALMLFSIASWAGAGHAAQENFEINLKELRPAPTGTTKTQQRSSRRSEGTKAQAPLETAKTEGSSIYTVRPGDHLFAILMRRYNLSNEAAERLIPEVLRLNGIRNPQGLTVGQRLTIPLPAPPERQTKTVRKQLPQAAPAPVQTATPAVVQPAQPQVPPPPPQAASQLSVQPEAKQEQQAAAKAVREVSISAATPCTLAQEMIKQLGLVAPSTKFILGEDVLTAEHAGAKVVVACDLSSDKAYTYERLLALHDIQLLIFTGAEPSKRVIKKVANSLSLSYQKTDPDATGNLPLTYLFPAVGPNGQDIRMTILP